MRRPFVTSPLSCSLAVLALALTSCKGTKPPPPLDRASFVEETSIQLPATAEILDSKTSADDQGIHYHVILKMPKSADGVLPGVGRPDDPKDRTNSTALLRQLDMTALSQAGVQLRDPNTPCRTYQVKTKSKGGGDARAYPDGETLYVLCDFGTTK